MECVALFARVKNTSIWIAANMLPVKTRWSESSNLKQDLLAYWILVPAMQVLGG